MWLRRMRYCQSWQKHRERGFQSERLTGVTSKARYLSSTTKQKTKVSDFTSLEFVFAVLVHWEMLNIFWVRGFSDCDVKSVRLLWHVIPVNHRRHSVNHWETKVWDFQGQILSIWVVGEVCCVFWFVFHFTLTTISILHQILFYFLSSGSVRAKSNLFPADTTPENRVLHF